VDGFIATAAAAIAEKFVPDCRALSSVIVLRRVPRASARAFKVRPILDLDLRLGEGTGAALAMNLIESALDLFEYGDLASAGVTGKVR